MTNLKILRNQAGLSQQQLADIFHLTQQSIHKYENDLSQPDIKIIKGFAAYFQTSIDYILDNSVFPCPVQYYEKTELSLEEQQLITDYRKASAKVKASIDTILNEISKTTG